MRLTTRVLLQQLVRSRPKALHAGQRSSPRLTRRRADARMRDRDLRQPNAVCASGQSVATCGAATACGHVAVDRAVAPALPAPSRAPTRASARCARLTPSQDVRAHAACVYPTRLLHEGRGRFTRARISACARPTGSCVMRFASRVYSMAPASPRTFAAPRGSRSCFVCAAVAASLDSAAVPRMLTLLPPASWCRQVRLLRRRGHHGSARLDAKARR